MLIQLGPVSDYSSTEPLNTYITALTDDQAQRKLFLLTEGIHGIRCVLGNTSQALLLNRTSIPGAQECAPEYIAVRASFP